MSKTTIHSFVPIQKLGEGSFSSVYKVRRVSDNQIYALKKIKMASLKQKERANALNQIRILASLSSEHIVTYKEAFFDESLKLLCIVMECADQGDLLQKIQKMKRSNSHCQEGEVWKAVYHIMKGLLVLHRNCILHRDLKSANIFIHDGVYKIGDLNVSKVNAERQLVKTQTGTPYYASPEVWRDESYGQKSDIWSFGCILYEMCCWKPPFHGNSLEDLYKNVQKGKFDTIPQVYSKDLMSLIAKCLSLNPKDRPSAEELLQIGGKVLQKCDFYEIQTTSHSKEGSTKQPLLSTIKVPYDMNSLNHKLPLSKYQTAQKVKKHSSQRYRHVTEQKDINQDNSLGIAKNVQISHYNYKQLDQVKPDLVQKQKQINTPLPQRIKNHIKSIAERKEDEKILNRRPKYRIQTAIGPRPPNSISRYNAPCIEPIQISKRRPQSCELRNKIAFRVNNRPASGSQPKNKKLMHLITQNPCQNRLQYQLPQLQNNYRQPNAIYYGRRQNRQKRNEKQRCRSAVVQPISSSYLQIRKRLQAREKQMHVPVHYSAGKYGCYSKDKISSRYCNQAIQKKQNQIPKEKEYFPIISKQVYLKNKNKGHDEQDRSYLIEIQNKLLSNANNKARKCVEVVSNQYGANLQMHRLRSLSQKYRYLNNVH